MDDFLKFMLQKNLEGLGDLFGDGGGASDAKLKAAILLIYNSSKERICKVADHIARGQIKTEDKLKITDKPQELTLPEIEEWDFKLGDTVRIKLSRDDFKWMQKKTLGWKGNLNEVYGQVGIVTNVLCKYENSINVYFPTIFTACSLYAGLLEKVPSPEFPNLQKRWKPGDYVKTISSQKVLMLLQRGLDQIPKDLIGKKGRVVAVTHPCVIVTFDERKTYDFKSGSLVPCHDKSSIESGTVVHPRGFKVGDKVKIISNMKKLIEGQKRFGGWNEDMSSIRGKFATIINIQEDGSLNVQTKNFRAWRLAPESILTMEQEEVDGEDIDFLPGDIVKVLVPRNIRSILAMAEVPSVFLEYLRSPALLSLVDDDIDYYIRFNHDQNIQTPKDILRKASTSENERYEKIKTLTENLSVGDLVHVDIGPPNFVQSVLPELDLAPKVKMALTKSAILEGFINPYYVVIKYDDGTRFRVKKKFLTVPEKFEIEEANTAISLETVEMIKQKVERSVQDIHSREGAATDEWSVTVSCLRQGKPSFVEFKVESAVATSKAISVYLEDNSGWAVDDLCDGQILIGGVFPSNEKLKVKVGMIFNDESSEWMMEQTYGQAETVSGRYSESGDPGNMASPNGPDNDRPNIENLQDFKFIRLYDEGLSRNVYFPYVLHGNRRTPLQPSAPTQDNDCRSRTFMTSHDRNYQW